MTRIPSPNYRASHHRVTARRGPARNYRCVDCPDVARDWSYDGGDANEVWSLAGHKSTSPTAYSTDPAYYVPRCRSCHQRHDRSARLALAA